MLILWHETPAYASNSNVFIRKQADNINLGNTKTGYVNKKNFNKIGNDSFNKNCITEYLSEDKTMSFYVNK